MHIVAKPPLNIRKKSCTTVLGVFLETSYIQKKIEFSLLNPVRDTIFYLSEDHLPSTFHFTFFESNFQAVLHRGALNLNRFYC